MRLFLDAEWADVEGRQLVSLALVDSSGQHRFYGEIDPLPLGPTTFVRDVVYPLLQRGDVALPALRFTAVLRAFLTQLPAPRLILSDHPTDFSLLRLALAGFGSEVAGEIPDWKPIEVTQGDVLGHRETYFERDEEACRRRHHAAVDAEALRWAFEYVIEGTIR